MRLKYLLKNILRVISILTCGYVFLFLMRSKENLSAETRFQRRTYLDDQEAESQGGPYYEGPFIAPGQPLNVHHRKQLKQINALYDENLNQTKLSLNLTENVQNRKKEQNIGLHVYNKDDTVTKISIELKNRTKVNENSKEKFNISIHNPEPLKIPVQGSQHETTLDDIFIGVKTTYSYHRHRLQVLLETWFQDAVKQTYFFTDKDDLEFEIKSQNHLIDTGCSPDHHRQALCCKFSVMFTKYLESGKKWFCHFDDDNYVNVANLVKLLQNYPADQDFYLGKTSLSHAIETLDRENDMAKATFWFATGGAGMCISRALALSMSLYAKGGSFQTTCNRIRLPDDVTVGFIVEYLLKKKLTKVPLFNSHLQALRVIQPKQISNQVSLSYGISEKRVNVVEVPNAKFTPEEDPTRFKSIHCHLFPDASLCRR